MYRFFLGLLFSAIVAFPATADYSAGAAAYRNGDFQTAYNAYLADADDGDSRSQFGLAVMYHTGKGVEKDYAKARDWYTKAAEQGNAKAQNNLGIIFRRGHGVERDSREAFTWIWMAAMQGYARAEMNLAEMYMLGEGVQKDLPMAYAWLESAVSALTGKSLDKAENRRDFILAELSDNDIARAKRMAKGMLSARQVRR